MINFLQMLHWSNKKGLQIEKYLLTLCILISVQMSTFAQGYTYMDVNPANPVKQGVVHVKPGTEVTISVSGQTIPGMPVTWMYRTERKPDVGPDNKQTLVGEIGTSITYNVTRDIEFQATYQSVFGQVTDRVLISCAELVLAQGETDEVCPEAAVGFAIVGGQLADDGYFEKKENGSAWQMKRQFPVEKEKFNGDTIVTRNESGTSNFSVRASLEYSYFNAEKGNVNFDAIDITIRTDCKAECLTTSTGDFYVGTDFDPNKEDAKKIPEDVESHFADYEIDFEKTGFNNYWLGSDASGFFGQDPTLDKNADVLGKNNYLFVQGNRQHEDGTFDDSDINDDIVKLKFQVWDKTPDPNKSGVKGKSYRYKMRMYIQADQCHKPIANAWGNAKFKAATLHGKQSSDCIEAYAYDDESGVELGHYVVDNGAEWIYFKDVINLNTIDTWKMIRFEVVFYGSFPSNPNRGLDYFVFTPRFEQFGCAKLAFDYISAEIENVCLSPNVVCKGDYTTANAAGFPRNSTYEWYKKVGNEWVKIDDISGNGDDYSKVQIKVEHEGKLAYKLHVTASGGYERDLEFSIGGKNCSVPKLTIDCERFEDFLAKSPIIVPAGKEETSFRMPIPDFDAGCDSDPKVTIQITPKRQVVYDTLGVKVINVYKSEIATSKLLNVKFPWGQYDFQYTVTDGCGHPETCVAHVEILKKDGPDIDCSKIPNIETILGEYNEGSSNECVSKFDETVIKIPQLEDRNDERHTILSGIYSGRRHFDLKQNKDSLLNLMEYTDERNKFDQSIQLYDEYEIEYTYILWTFTNDAGNSSYCIQEVLVKDTTKPAFDCGQIENPFRPETVSGSCEINFVDFKDELMSKNYLAYVNCPKPGYTVPGELHFDPLNIDKVTDDHEFKVGIAQTMYWQFRVHHSWGDVVKSCPQEINAKSSDQVKVDCEAIAYFEATAKPGTCSANAADLKFPRPPYGFEPCLDENGDSIKVYGVGTRSDGKGLEEDYPTGHTYITWLFAGENSKPATCTTHIFVRGNNMPDIDCKSLFPKRYIDMSGCEPEDVELFPQKVADICVPSYMMESEPYIVDKTDSTKLDLIHTFSIGETIVTWVFWDYTHSISSSCEQSIHLRDTFPPDPHCELIPDARITLHGECTIPYEDLRDQLGDHYATEYCTGIQIPGIPYLLDTITGQRMEFPSEISVGYYQIQWYFANDSLTTKDTVCDKRLTILHDFDIPFDCDDIKDQKFTDDKGLCKIVVTDKLLPIPNTNDACVKDYTIWAEGYIQLDRQGEFVKFAHYDRKTKKAVYEFDLPFGKHIIKWHFVTPYSDKTKDCYQTVIARSDALDKFSCDDLADYVLIEYKGSEIGPSFAEVVEAGLKKPDIDAIDVCHVLDTIYTRSDYSIENPVTIYDRYPVNTVVTITWIIKDRTYDDPANTKICYTKVEVRNGDIGVPVCPEISNSFECENDLPAPYADLNDFIANNGDVISRGESVVSFIDPSSFSVTSRKDGDGICDYYYIRTYHFKDFRGQEASCDQRIHIKDDKAPQWQDLAAGIVSPVTKQFNCSADNFFPDQLKAKDICSGKIYSNLDKVNKFDGTVDGLYYTVESTRGSDPYDCSYYNYKETRKYVAVDQCRNYSTTLEFVANVVDNEPPTINMPDTASWRSKFVPAVYAPGYCQFLYPDLVSNFPKDSIHDNCGDDDVVKYFKIYQIPSAKDTIKNTKIPQFVTLYVEDPCGNTDTLKKLISVQDTKDIISLKFDTATVCVESGLTVLDLSKTTGRLLQEDWFNPGEWTYKNNTNVWFDIYKGDFDAKNNKLDENMLVYSNNTSTYASKFDQVVSSKKYIGLNKLSDEGLYTIVAMDTLMHCTDTAQAYIKVHSSPTVHLDPSPLVVCENDSIHLTSDNEPLVEKYNISYEENGEPVSKTALGWMVDKTFYEPGTLLHYTDGVLKLQYYAINKCGTGISNEYISLSMRKRMNPDDFMLTTEPNNPSRVFSGESAKLNLVTKYKPESMAWYRVKGTADGNSDEMFDKYGNVRQEYVGPNFEPDSLLEVTYLNEPNSKTKELYQLGDSAQYYVLLIDDVCPAVPSNIVAIDVVTKLPTAFTPHNSLGMNDVFMEGHKVIIFNRYGQKMTESDNGWDGTCRGNLVDPGVYFYEVVINEGQRVKGSIEVVYFK